MQNPFSEDRLRLAARLYYLEGFGQRDVAKFVRVSQPMVSRLLARARERGLVRISVADYEPRHVDLEDQLRRCFGLETVIVIKSFYGPPDADLRRSIGHFASLALDTLIRPGDTVAVAGGRTIYELVRRLPKASYQALSIVQAMGSVSSPVSAFDAHEIGKVMAQRLGGTFVAFDTPAYIVDPAAREALLQRPQRRAVIERLGSARLALVGVGTLENSIFVESGVLKPDELVQLRRAGAVAEVAGRFFNEQGQECDTPWRDQVMSLAAEQLRAIPQVIAVVSGDDRVTALAAAIRGRLIRGLVIDESAAHALLVRNKTAKRKS